MAYLYFDKSKLVNLEHSLFKEILRTNRAGSYSSSSIIGCNTRKYHGLLVCPLKQFNNERHVFISSLDATVIQHGKEFNLGIHKYMGSHYEPKGHKYIRDLEFEDIPKAIYRVGGVVLSIEQLLSEQEEQVLLKYTLVEANSPTKIRLKPFLAFRSVHTLTNENLNVNTKYQNVESGIKLALYENFPFLNMQIDKENEFVPVPDWYRGVEYIKEQHRGYDYKEDLYVPGYFELDIKKGESVIFSASLSEVQPSELHKKFQLETAKRIARDSLENNLLNSAEQFFVKNGDKTELIAGYHWYGTRVRDALIALPGLSFSLNDKQTFLEVVNTMRDRIIEGFLNRDKDVKVSVDAPLWLFWTIQECRLNCKENSIDWKEYYPVLKEIILKYKNSEFPFLKVQSNGLLYIKEEGVPHTWMDAIVNGNPVTPRYGMPVEINALWYNAIKVLIELAKENEDYDFVHEWEAFASDVSKSFIEQYWNWEGGFLYDCIDGVNKDDSIRPNQVFATALPYSPLTKEEKKKVLDVVQQELLTSKGLRSLSPKNVKYKGVIEGSVAKRDAALHQGTVWPWLTAFFVEGYLSIHKKSGVSFVKSIIENFDEEMRVHCLGSIPECFNGNPPHKGKGAISMAWNVAGLLKILRLIDKYI